MATTLIDMGLGGSGTQGGGGAGTPVVSTQVTDPQVQAIVQMREESEKNKKLITWLAIGLGLLLVVNMTNEGEGDNEDES